MKGKIVQYLKSLTSTKILAAVFVIFSIYVGLAAFPQFLTSSGTALTEKKSFTKYIDNIDEQYFGMLSTDLDQPMLHNKGTYINLNGFMANIMGQVEMNDRIKLKNGYLSTLGTSFKKEKMDEVFVNIQNLCQKQTEQGKYFLFVLAPSKSWKSEEYFPVGYYDKSNTDATYLLNLFDANGIPYLDLRESLEEENIAFEDIFFATDHHWTPQTGFWAYTKILNKLEEMGAVGQLKDLYVQKNNYNFDIYENSFLGSSGKRTGRYYAGLDDFCLISPKFDTNINIKIEKKNIDLTGRFEEIAYSNLDNLEKNDYFNENPYALYGWADQALISWRNDMAPEKSKVLMIGDSFGNVPFSLMSLYFASCEELDMRHFDDNFTEFYEKFNPDTTIFLINLNRLLAANASFPFFRDVT